MRPIEKAAQIWEKAEKSITFQDRIGVVVQSDNGFIHSSPYSFIMGSALSFEEKNAWFVEIAVGNIYEIVRSIPYSLPFVAFCRGCKGDHKLHIYPVQRFLRKLYAYVPRGDI